MRRTATRGRGLAAAIALAALAGCISVFPKETPAQLYRFGLQPVPAQPRAAASAAFAVLMLPTSFDRPAAGDGILTMTGAEAAYIKGSRWVGAAASLFDAAVLSAFDARGGPARLIARGDAGRPDFVLKLDVRRFEADYDHGQSSPPTIVLEVYATLTPAADHDHSLQRLFVATAPAEENRAGPITSAFDQATRKALGDLVDWVGAKGAG
jgi:cholesterol transport system auxiliary component